jgi:protein subunit release factor A
MDAQQAEGILHAWLAAGGVGAQFFVNDVTRMLRAKALRQGIVAKDAALDAGATELVDHQFLAISGLVIARLADEVGIHRVQFVPPESQTGRIETAMVAVEFLKYGQPATSGHPGWPIVKTYNYVLRSCVRHATGRITPLDDALAGEA